MAHTKAQKDDVEEANIWKLWSAGVGKSEKAENGINLCPSTVQSWLDIRLNLLKGDLATIRRLGVGAN